MATFTVSGLAAYIEQQAHELISATVTGAPTLKTAWVSIQAGIKYQETINIMDTVQDFQSDAGCSFSTSGTTTFTQRTITVNKLKMQMTYCPDELEQKYTSARLVKGSYYDTLPFEKEITDLMVQKMNFNLEKMLWQGDTTNHVFDNNLKLINGWIQVIDAAGAGAGVIYATSQTSITTSTVRGIFEDIHNKIPQALLGTEHMPTAFCGWDTFRTLCQKLTQDNLYHYTVDDNIKTGEMYYPGTMLKIKALTGLSNITGTTVAYKDRIIATWPENLYYGTDMANEYEDFKIWYSLDDQNIKVSVKFKAATQIAFPQEIVTYKNT